MNGALHQALTLTVTGNAFLQGRPIGAFWPAASAFAFCLDVRFAADDGAGPAVVAGDPDEWLGLMTAAGAGLKLQAAPRDDPKISDIMSAAFANGGPRWLIEAVLPDRASTYWEPYWELSGDPEPPGLERRIWSVTYWRLPERAVPPLRGERAIADVAASLAETLDALRLFVERAAPEEAMPGWAEVFRGAWAALGRAAAHEPGDPAPADFLSPAALALIHGCRAGWVFGGMGAWNDGGYWGAAEREGDRLSEKLFGLLQDGAAAAANSSFRPPRGAH